MMMKMGMFTAGVVMAQIVGLLFILTIGIWMGHFQGGFSWQEDPHNQFNYHPLFMSLGMIFLFGNAILAYRVFRNQKKMLLKIVHASLQILVLIFSIVGLKSVFDSHNLPKERKPNMWSLHSWLGITTVVMFALQWVLGLISFLFPKVSLAIKQRYKPIHVFWGIAIYIMAIATALMGITENVAFHVLGKNKHEHEQKVIAAIAGMLMVILGILVVHLVTKEEYARVNPEDEQHVQLTE